MMHYPTADHVRRVIARVRDAGGPVTLRSVAAAFDPPIDPGILRLLLEEFDIVLGAREP